MQKTSLIFLSLLILVLSTSCGVKNDKPQGSVSSELKPYLDKFESYARANGIDVDSYSLSMSFSESMPKSDNGGFVIGYCQRSIEGQNVVIQGSYWNSASVSDREQLIFHELGHCLLGLSHNDTIENAPIYNWPNAYATNVPSSIMNTFHFDSRLYSGNRETYVKRLFGLAKSVPLFWNAPSQIDTNEYN